MERGGDIQSYFQEVAAALKDLEDSEDDSRAMLAQNALEEVFASCSLSTESAVVANAFLGLALA